MDAPVLVIEHEAQCPPGWVGDWLEESGLTLDVRRPYRGEPLPDDLDRHCAMVVLGGSMDAYADEEHAWLTSTKELIRRAAADGTPTLGICLGHQLVAVALGGRAEKNPLGQQMGVLPIGWLPEAETDDLFAGVTDIQVAVQWNCDIVVELPAAADALARTVQDEIQVARFGASMWGVQMHPEVDAQTVARWADNDRDDCLERGVDVDAYLAQIVDAHDELRSAWSRVTHRFAVLARDAVATW